MTLPASLQSIRSLPQFLNWVGSVDVNHDGYLQLSEAQLFSKDWFYDADTDHNNRLQLSEIAETMRHSGPPLNKLFSTDVVQSFQDLQSPKSGQPLTPTPLRAAWVNEWVNAEEHAGDLKARLVAAARVLNWMGDEGCDGKLFFRDYMNELSPESLYLLLAMAGSDLAPPLFAQVAERLEATPELKNVIEAADSQKALLPDFFLKMVARGRSRNYLSRIKDLIFAAVTQAVHSKDVYLVPTLLPALKALATFSRETADQLGDTLLRSYDETGDRRLKMGFQFLLWSLRKYLRSPEVKKVALDPTTLLTPPGPDAWLADGVLWAAVVFDSDQKLHRDRLVKMLRQEGFSLTHLIGDETVKEKVQLEKVVNGVTLRVSVMYAPIERYGSEEGFSFFRLVRSRADIVSMRAHHSSALYYLKQCRNGCEMANKLVFNGGCEGAGNVPELMRAYRGNLFVADKDIGRGHDNSLVLYHMMRAIAGGATDWGQVHRQVKAHVPVDQWGLLLPDDDLLKFYYTLDAPVYLPIVQDPLADQSTWVLFKNSAEPTQKPKGKIKLGKMKVVQHK